MKRRNYKALVTDDTGLTVIGELNTFAWNSAIKATETILREHARRELEVFHGQRPVVQHQDTPERTYTRVWTNSSGQTLRALVWEVV